MLNKKDTTAYIRLVIQILFLILLPGLFTMIFGEMRTIYTAIISGKFNFETIVQSTLPLLILIPLTMILGRFFCGFMCAFGTINDLLYEFSSRVFKIKFRINKSVDKYLKLIKYFVLLFIVIGVWTLGYSGFNNLNPWDAFAQLTQLPPSIPNIMAFVVLVLILIGGLFIERFFCRYFCPLGAFLSLLQAFRIVKIDKNKKSCLNGCSACSKSCSMGIDLDKVNKVDSLECIQCMNCIGVCPKENAKLTVLGKVLNELIIILIFILAFVGFKGLAEKLVEFKISNEGQEKKSNIFEQQPRPDGKGRHGHGGEMQQQVQNVDVTQGQYKDGKYTGQAIGFKPGLTVEVTISGGKISKIEILDHNETPSYAEIPFQIIPDEIIKSQSTKVDAVSGATRTSVGIMNAVAEALKQAQK